MLGNIHSCDEQKGRKECFSGIYQQLSMFYDMRTPHLHRGPNFLSHREYISLHFLSLVNLFLGDTRTAHEETDCKRVSESAEGHTVAANREKMLTLPTWFSI
ncbi:unnamed protein product [Rangifer tarandus platyrhynchus]|uniref:Uncharacterized protein n=1 Tax=Rangifer tarandus platyrhynchus TaxID=3082113 RepID=A0ABN8XZY4_RANTA|nr:unnamed protein product [Rangifer tarandus platyrhynchus]